MASTNGGTPPPAKKDNQVKAWVDDPLYAELARLADADDRSLSEYVERVLRTHVFGHRARRGGDGEGPNQT